MVTLSNIDLLSIIKVFRFLILIVLGSSSADAATTYKAAYSFHLFSKQFSPQLLLSINNCFDEK
tara:strand:+ start:829 stop:1020 length:192 start_codon:yes stop_codon:yes gene_type:complete